MDIVIIGTGNVATVLGRKFRMAGHQIVQVAGRNVAAISLLAKEWETTCTDKWALINASADIIIIAVTDNAIGELAIQIKAPDCVVVHTAASVSKNMLEKSSPHFGVFYPLQSLRKDLKNIPDIPVLYDGSDEMTNTLLKKLAGTISTTPAAQAGDDMRLKLHVAAVIVSNFTNYLYTIAEDFCRKEALDFQQLLPLIEETAVRIRNISPGKVQTGPAIRHDNATIHKHLALLEKYPEIKKLYSFLSENIAFNKTS